MKDLIKSGQLKNTTMMLCVCDKADQIIQTL